LEFAIYVSNAGGSAAGGRRVTLAERDFVHVVEMDDFARGIDRGGDETTPAQNAAGCEVTVQRVQVAYAVEDRQYGDSAPIAGVKAQIALSRS
jgi:hypothetical protein